MNLLHCALIASAALSACSPDSSSQVPESMAARPSPVLPPSLASATEVIGVVDNPQALDAFLNEKGLASRESPPSVVAHTVNGGAAHPRITLVYMSTPKWCGSGGCTLLVLAPRGGGRLAELSRITLVHPPVLVLDTRTNGMPDISVRVRSDYYPGEGKKFVVLPFDGQTYASNPTPPPARLVQHLPDGEIAISEGEVAIAFHR